LDCLKDLKIKKAVATSTNRKITVNLLALAAIDSNFDYVLCGDEIVNSKPDPEIFLKVAGKLHCRPEHCIVLEDSEAGIRAAYRAGMLPILIPDLKVPDRAVRELAFRQVSDLLEVKKLLEDL
jgi:HAD superfamily hydrolase (TIGR01509 family)